MAILSPFSIIKYSIPSRIQKSSEKRSPFLVRSTASSSRNPICSRFGTSVVLLSSSPPPPYIDIIIKRKISSTTQLNAAFAEIEPDLNEDPKDKWVTPGVTDDEFIHGKWDGHHTYFEGEEEKVSFWGSIAEDIASVDPPKGFQGLISWLFLPAVAAGLYFDVPGEYLYIGAALFVIIFCIIEIDKPSEAHNFEPQIYNMERGARDKLISQVNFGL